MVVEGTGASALRAGAGHYPNTPLPGEEGNVAIAGHRTTYGKPFANLDRLKPGDEIILETPVGKYTYKVSRDPFVVTPHRLERHHPDAREDPHADHLPPQGLGPAAHRHQGRAGLRDGEPARPA